MPDSDGPDGLLIVDKPSGMTSHDVVDRVRKVLGTKKVGHGGTLDPDATGVLVVGVGKATRLLTYSQSAPKHYRARATFGVTTSTQDASGELIEARPATLERADVEAVLADFTGSISQIPPMVSAVKVGGERLYKKARRGEEVERTPRAVTIYSLSLTSWEEGEHPTATLEVRCSAGTYIRTLVADIGERLGCGAHLAALRRTASGGFTIDDAVSLDAISSADLKPMLDVVGDMRRVEVGADDVQIVSHGGSLGAVDDAAEDEVVAITNRTRLLGIYRRRGEALIPEKVLA